MVCVEDLIPPPDTDQNLFFYVEFGEIPELLENLEANYEKWQEESQIWPRQRDEELSKIGRVSIDSLNSAPFIQETSSSAGSIPETPLLCGDS